MHLGSKSAIAFPLALLMLLAIVTFWINKIVEPLAAKIDGSSRHDPDYMMNNFVTTQTDINGDLRYKLAAIEMRHFPDDDSTSLQRPRYTQFAVNKPYTQVQALRGEVSGDGDEVKLYDKVKVTRQAFEGKGEMTVETDYLNIRPNEELVTTDRPLVIRQFPKTVIYATGMIYEKNKRTVTLLHNVRAHYERPVMNTTKNNSLKVRPTSKASDNTKAVTKSSPKKPVKAVKKSTLKQENIKQKNESNTNDARIRRRYE